MDPILVAFDFDHTIVEYNSDIIAQNLVPTYAITQEIEALNTNRGWTLYMREIFKLLKHFHIGEETVKKAISDIPPVAGIPELFTFLKTIPCEIIIVSDSNSYFIEAWLSQAEIDSVHKVYTNPAKFDGDLLAIEPYHKQDWCRRCSVNLCKGSILVEHIAEAGKRNTPVKYSRVLYIGDGNNDYCPATKLSHGDVVFPREGYNLYKILVREQDAVRANVVPWNDARSIVQHIISLTQPNQ